MPKLVRLAVLGLGRIGAIHALHAAEIAREQAGCRLAALVDPDTARAESVAAGLVPLTGDRVPVFAGVEELIASGAADASVIATPTHLHHAHASALIDAGHRVLLEKPMTDSLASDREFARRLDADAPRALMLAFQRRFDAALLDVRRLLRDGVIGRPFKVVSVLEDSRPLPDGYSSPGIFYDMSVHNVDEVLWLVEDKPVEAVSIGARLFGHRLTSAEEDFDDGLMYLWFAKERIAQIQISRNHVAGYRNETWVFGEDGFVHAGHFDGDRSSVKVEAYARDRAVHHAVFPLRDYGRPLPEFVGRFGDAYKAELAEFVSRICAEEPFRVTHADGLRAMEVIDAARRGLIHQPGS